MCSETNAETNHQLFLALANIRLIGWFTCWNPHAFALPQVSVGLSRLNIEAMGSDIRVIPRLKPFDEFKHALGWIAWIRRKAHRFWFFSCVCSNWMKFYTIDLQGAFASHFIRTCWSLWFNNTINAVNRLLWVVEILRPKVQRDIQIYVVPH